MAGLAISLDCEPSERRWAVLVVFYLILGLLGAWYLSGTTSPGADLATYQRAGEALYTTGNPYAANAGVPEDYVYRYPPLLAMVIPVLGWPPLWFTLIGFATIVPMVVGYRVSGPAGLLPVALLVGAWGQQLLNGNVQAFVVALLAIVPLTRGAGAIGLAVATMLKIHPVLAIVWYAGRREWRLLGIYGVAMLVLTLIQLPWIPDMIDFYLADPVATETIPACRCGPWGSRRGSSGPRRSGLPRTSSPAPATAGCWRPSSSLLRFRACCSSTWRCCWRRRCLLGRRRARPNDPSQHRQPHRDERERDQEPRERRQPARAGAKHGLDSDQRPGEVVDEGVRTGEDPGEDAQSVAAGTAHPHAGDEDHDADRDPDHDAHRPEQP